MIAALILAATFAATVLSGPAGREWLERRRSRALTAPLATIHYLPSAACRERSAEALRAEHRELHRRTGCASPYYCSACDDPNDPPEWRYRHEMLLDAVDPSDV